MNILVIDVGTSSMRGILMNEHGQEIAKEQRFYSAIYMENGWVEQDPEDWKQALYSISKAISQVYPVDAITLTSQRSSVIPVDSKIEPLCNAIMWQDKRTMEICQKLAVYNDAVFARCGSRVNPVFSAGKMTWIREMRPEIYEKTFKFLVIPDYLHYLMTGELKTDHTYGSRSLLMNLERREWDEELLNLFSIEPEKLCELVPVGSIIGTVTHEYAEKTGVPEGIPVVTAGGDQQCGAIGQGVVTDGVVSVTAGTGGFLITMVPELPEGLQQDVIANCASVAGQYVLESSVLTCCAAYDWFRKEFYPEADYEELNREIECSEPGAGGCICMPYFQGRSTPDWNTEATAAWSGVTLGTQKRDLLRSLWEGICCEIGNGIKAMEKYTDVKTIRVNGGLTNSDLFNQMQSDMYAKTVLRSGNSDATARGAWMVAAAALGLYPSVEKAYRTVTKAEPVQRYEPEPARTAVYAKVQTAMNDLYQKIYG